MSTSLDARRLLGQHSQEGNWRLKGLLLAGMEEGASRDDFARAWPSTKDSSSYRILSRHNGRDAETEKNRTVVAEKGSSRYRALKDLASGSTSRTLSAAKPEEIDGGRALGAPLDDSIKRMLFSTSTNEEVDILFREQLLETIMQGSQRRQIARDVSNVLNVDTRRGDIPIAEDDRSGRLTAEGAEIRDDGEDYTTVEWNCEKVAAGSRITEEMVDHGIVDLIERQVEDVGRRVENSINEVFLTNAIDDAVANGQSVTFDDTVDDPGYQALNRLYGEVDKADFNPDQFIRSPGYRTEVFSNDNLRFVNRSGSDEVVRDRMFDPLLDMTHQGASLNSYDDEGKNVPGGGANDFQFTDSSGAPVAGGIGALILQQSHNHLILYAPNGNDIEVKDYDDPIRDLRGFNARIHVDHEYSQARSAGVIEQP
jgi:Phage capsid family.